MTSLPFAFSDNKYTLTSKIRNTDAGETYIVLGADENPGSWNQLLLSMDQGGCGRAGGAFAKHFLNRFVWVSFDIVHRLIRDIKLSLGSCFKFQGFAPPPAPQRQCRVSEVAGGSRRLLGCP